MPRSKYTKQLEEENEALKKRLEVADLKAECYDYIMSGMVLEANNVFANRSEVLTNRFVLFVKSKIDKNNMVCMKIINDMIEDEKMMQGWNKK